PSIRWNKPPAVGFAILNLSKLLVYKFHYDVMKRQYGEKCSLLFTDTDSLTYSISCPDIYKDMSEKLELYDTSNFDNMHRCFSIRNKGRLGVMKDETQGVPIREFVGLRAKMYSLKLTDSEQKQTAKGIQHAYAKKHLKHDLYKNCLLNKVTTTANYQQIRSHNHQLETEKIEKSCL